MMKKIFYSGLIFVVILVACNNERPIMETPSTVPLLTPKEQLPVGIWGSVGISYTLQDDYTYIRTVPFLAPVAMAEYGTWQQLADGFVEFIPDTASEIYHRVEDGVTTYRFKLQEDTLMISDAGYAYRKLDDKGNPLPIPETNSDVSLPLFEIQEVTNIQIHRVDFLMATNMTTHTRYDLIKNEFGFEGQTEFTTAEDLDHIQTLSDTMTISVPLPEMKRFLSHLSNTSLIEETYSPKHCFEVVRHIIEISLTFENKIVQFCSARNSEEIYRRLIPWFAKFNGQEYLSYSDEVELALDVIDPFLARDVEMKFYQEADDFYKQILWNN